MSSFACITSDEWKESQTLEKSLEQFTLDYIESLKNQKQTVKKQLEREILKLEQEIKEACEALDNH